MKYITIGLFICSIVITYISSNLFISRLLFSLGLFIIGIWLFNNPLDKRKKLSNPKLTKGITRGLACGVFLLSILLISDVVRDGFGRNVIAYTGVVRKCDDRSGRSYYTDDFLFNTETVCIGNDNKRYKFSLINSDTEVLNVVQDYLRKQGPDTVFYLQVAPHTKVILSAQVVE